MEFKTAAASQQSAIVAENTVIMEIKRLSKILSAYDSESEFSRWMKTSNRPVTVSKELFTVLQLFDEWREKTGGALDASAEVVEKAAWNFLRKGAKVGLWHEPGHDDAAEVVESYVWRGEPWVIKAANGTDQTIMAGDWLVGLVLSEPTWELYKSGDIGGVSPQGRGKRKVPDAATLAKLRS